MFFPDVKTTISGSCEVVHRSNIIRTYMTVEKICFQYALEELYVLLTRIEIHVL